MKGMTAVDLAWLSRGQEPADNFYCVAGPPFEALRGGMIEELPWTLKLLRGGRRVHLCREAAYLAGVLEGQSPRCTAG